jgi:1,2-diacylglycerol 3-alpha-glucosyltransferase
MINSSVLNNKAIGLFCEVFTPIADGVSVTVKNYAYWLNKKVAQTYVITPKFPHYTDNEEFPVIRYLSLPVVMHPPYRAGLPELDAMIMKELKKLPLGLIHSHSPFSSGVLARKIAKHKKIPIIATFHSKFKDDYSRFIPNKIIVNQIIKGIIKFFESVDEVWIPQRAVEETIREYGFKGKLEVVENGIDFDKIENISQFRRESRIALNIHDNTNVFLFVGQHTWEKNLKFLIESLGLIRNEKFIMYFVGDGYAKHEMIRLVSELGISDKVKFLGSIYDREELKKIYASADLFLFPSLYDNAPLVLREAAAMHTPGLLLRGSTASEVIHDGENGFLSDNDTLKYAEKIKEIIRQNELLKNVGINASLTLCRRWEDIINEVADRYEKLILRKK